eukprot:TRINITY_DN1506_c0_g1_i1.p1 TRINITY_DN1506_c0_g1~~TRINITY_DN1506_c0_g1_i1.p1  ORF type:complete len:286 (-),score=27.64 TRINITY_DN1506_c0_g1_i1:83-940(-)
MIMVVWQLLGTGGVLPLARCVRPWEIAALEAEYKSGVLTNAKVDSFCSTETTKPTIARVGGASDSHGCIGSAGYRWCEKQSSCIRPWEVPELSELYKSGSLLPEHVDNFCAVAPKKRPVGGLKDDNGCIRSAGYVYCAKLQRCIRPFSEPQLKSLYQSGGLSREAFESFCAATPAPTKSLLGADNHECRLSAGFQWCETLSKCTRPWEIPELQTLHKEGLLTHVHFEHFCKKLLHAKNGEKSCLVATGYVWCEKEQKCTRPWELAQEKDFENASEAFNNYCENKQ